MPRKHQLFTLSELQQTQTILSSSDFGSRPLVKGFTIDIGWLRGKGERRKGRE